MFQDDFVREVSGRIRSISTSENEGARTLTRRQVAAPPPPLAGGRQVSPKSSSALVRSPSCPDLDRPTVTTAVTAVQTEAVFPYAQLLDACTAPGEGRRSNDDMADTASSNPYNVLDQVRFS